MKQPMPVSGKQDVLPEVIKDFMARDSEGRRKYGTTLQTFNGRDAMRDLYEELMDACLYLKQAIIEMEHVDGVIGGKDGNSKGF